MDKLNKQCKNFVNKLPQGFFRNVKVDKSAIKTRFDEYFERLNLPKLPIQFYENKKGGKIVINIIKQEATHNIIRNDVLTTNGDAVGNPVWNDRLNSDLYNIQENNRKNAFNAVWDVVQNTGGNIVHNVTEKSALNSNWDDNGNIARNNAGDTIRGTSGNAACLNICDKNDNCYICQFRRNYIAPICKMFKNGLFTFGILKDKIIAITYPTIKQVNGKLHSTTGPAIEGPYEKYYFLFGVQFDKKLGQKIVNKQLSFEQIMNIANIEQRIAATKMMDKEELLYGEKLLYGNE